MSDDAIAVPVLELKDLTVSYAGNLAVRGLSLTVEPGEIFGLLGPNGAGKTSTLAAIEGLRKPDSGSINVVGIDVLKHPLDAKAQLGVQLQSSSFQPELTIMQITALYAGLYGLRTDAATLQKALQDMGLGTELSKRYKQLSGGQQQRLSLFIATIHKPRLLLLDEPTAGLDPQARRKLWDTITKMSGAGTGILLTTHSMEEAQAICDTVTIIEHGALVGAGSPTELIAQYGTDPKVLAAAHGPVTLEDVFIGLTEGGERD